MDDELTVAARQLAEDLPSAADSMRDGILKAVVSTALPFGVGSAITGIVTETADRRWKERVVELIGLFAQRIAEVSDLVDTWEYYADDEFQALFVEAVDQQRTNRYEMKRDMLARGLARSGTRPFTRELRKEPFFLTLRAMSPEDIHRLKTLAEPTNAEHLGLVLKEQTLERITKAKAVDPYIYRLQGLGLVTTFQRLPAPNLSGKDAIQDQGALNRFVAQALAAEPQVVMKISSFGQGFLRFLSDRKVEHQPDGTSAT